MVEIPKVKSYISARSNPEKIIFWQISSRVGKKSTDSGRYRYASDLENRLPNRGKIWWKYNLKIGPINFGNPDEKSIKELAEKIREFTGSKLEFEYRDLPVDDPLRRKPDISKAKELLGWEPKVEFKEGIKKTIDFFKTSLIDQQ